MKGSSESPCWVPSPRFSWSGRGSGSSTGPSSPATRSSSKTHRNPNGETETQTKEQLFYPNDRYHVYWVLLRPLWALSSAIACTVTILIGTSVRNVIKYKQLGSEPSPGILW